jgi:hypothetical protein
LPQVLAERSAEVAEAVTRAVASHIVPSSAWLSAEHHGRERELMRTRMVERVVELAASGEPYSHDDLLLYENLGRLFARHGVPLRVLMDAFDVGITAITGESWRIAPAGRFAEMAQFTDRAGRLMNQARQVSASAYLEAGQSGSNRRPVRWALAEALIAGESAVPAAQAAGTELAPGYLVMACAVASPARSGALDGPEIGQAVEDVPGALYCAEQSRLIILLPVQASHRSAEAAAATLTSRLCALAGRPVRAAHAYRPGLASIPAALDEARRALRLALAIPDAGHRPYQMDDLLVELAISQQPGIRQRLAALLTPLEEGADLLHTLEVLLASNLDRERTARELCIHRRTLRYRIDRIRDLSGINPDQVQGLQLLRAALTAARLTSQEPHETAAETAG